MRFVYDFPATRVPQTMDNSCPPSIGLSLPHTSEIAVLSAPWLPTCTVPWAAGACSGKRRPGSRVGALRGAGQVTAGCFAWFGFILPLQMKEARTFHVPGRPPGLHGRAPVRGAWGRWRELNFVAPAPLVCLHRRTHFRAGRRAGRGAHPNRALALLLLLLGRPLSYPRVPALFDI